MKIFLALGLFLASTSTSQPEEIPNTASTVKVETVTDPSQIVTESTESIVDQPQEPKESDFKVLGVLYYHKDNRIEIVDQNYTRYQLYFIKGANGTKEPEFVKTDSKLDHSLIVYLSNIPLVKFFGDVDGESYFILEKDARHTPQNPLVHFYQLNWKEKTMFDLLGSRFSDLLMTTHVIDLNGDIKHHHYFSKPVLFGLLGWHVLRSDPDGSLTSFGRWMNFDNGPLCRMPHFVIKISDGLGVVIYRSSQYSIEPVQAALDMQPHKNTLTIEPLAKKA